MMQITEKALTFGEDAGCSACKTTGETESMSPENETGRRVRERRRRKQIRRRRILTAALACLILAGAIALISRALPRRAPDRKSVV